MMWPSPQPEKMSIVNTIYKQRFLPCVEYWARAFAQNLWSTFFLGPVSQEWCKNIYIHFYTFSKEQIEQFALRKIHFSKLIKKYLSVRTWSKNINTLFLWSMFHTHHYSSAPASLKQYCFYFEPIAETRHQIHRKIEKCNWNWLLWRRVPWLIASFFWHRL